ncbi:MAG TPA: GIDE domain-containing protein [Armatimonadota bacterium]|nr:GIDE domain-containing protein [Armatimonadota bacterium]
MEVGRSLSYNRVMWQSLTSDARASIIAGGISLVLSIVLILYYRHAKGLLDEMWAVHTYKAGELRKMCSSGFNAIVEVEGTIACESPISAPGSKLPCAWCRTIVERQVSTSSGSGKQHSWKKDYDNVLSTLFKVKDETGYTLVDPTNAEIEAEKPYQLVTSEREPWFTSVGYSDTGFYRITEQIFVPTGYVYVLGEASCTGEGPMPDALIHYAENGYVDPKKPFFIISRKSEKQITQTNEVSLKICLYGGILGFFFAAYCVLSLLGIVP